MEPRILLSTYKMTSRTITTVETGTNYDSDYRICVGPRGRRVNNRDTTAPDEVPIGNNNSPRHGGQG